jgi:hypothetical protein
MYYNILATNVLHSRFLRVGTKKPARGERAGKALADCNGPNQTPRQLKATNVFAELRRSPTTIKFTHYSLNGLARNSISLIFWRITLIII